jgi:hypothetical protein
MEKLIAKAGGKSNRPDAFEPCVENGYIKIHGLNKLPGT